MTDVSTMLTRALGTSKLFLLKHAPTIMTYGGIVVTGIGIYMFCKASTQLNDKLDIHDSRMEELENAKIAPILIKKIFKRLLTVSVETSLGR